LANVAETNCIQLGLIGYPVEHSLSPAMHNAAFSSLGLDFHYSLLPTPTEEFATRIRKCIDEGFAGWNITVPHKARMLSYLDELGDEVRATGACNTIRVQSGKLIGHNTDPQGFFAGLQEAGGIPYGANVVLLGAGGAARAVAYALASTGHPVLVLARQPAQAEALACSLDDARVHVTAAQLDATILNGVLEHSALLVNCTPAGMHPHDHTSPLPEGTTLPDHLLVYDLVYRPRPTRLLQHAANRGCRTQDGLSMLIHQGAASFRIWTGYEAPVAIMRAACHAALASQKQEAPTL
jgi:shikimate dehydrogenase